MNWYFKAMVLLMVFCVYFVQFAIAYQDTGGPFGFIFGYQKICFCRCGIAQRQLSYSTKSGRLLGGEPITPHQFPWLATVSTGSKTFGGSLVSDRHVITVGSLLQGTLPAGISVTLGSLDLCGFSDPALIIGVESVHLHPGYSHRNMNNNIALLRMRHVVPFSQYISPVCLPENDAAEANQVAWISSWLNDSSIYSCTPYVAALPMLPSRACFKAVAEYKLMTADKGCLGPVGAKSIICKTDVGAPVMSHDWRWTTGATFRLVGVVSSASCDSQEPPLFTRIIDHIDWIRGLIRSDCQCF